MTVKVNEPGVVGVPLSVPLLARLRPVGSVPAVTLKVREPQELW
jgi:hypothetical protein